MKKLISLLLCAVFVFAFSACGQGSPAPAEPEGAEEAETLPGGWVPAADPTVTVELNAKLERALDGLVGASFIPVAYMGSQVVSGTNYALLCRMAFVVPEAVETYALVYLYEALDGSVELTKVLDSGRATDLGELPGGWFSAESPVLTEDVAAALSQLNDPAMEPLALLSSQVVAGQNFCVLCRISPDPAAFYYALVYLYVDLSGRATVTETVPFLEAEAEEAEPLAQIANPYVGYSSLDAAAAAAGFPLSAPEALDGYPETEIQVMNGSMIQVQYRNEEDRLTIRKAPGSEDISGDYNVYTEQEVSVGELDITLKSAEDGVHVALWTNGGYTYAVLADAPLSVEEALALVVAIA